MTFDVLNTLNRHAGVLVMAARDGGCLAEPADSVAKGQVRRVAGGRDRSSRGHNVTI